MASNVIFKPGAVPRRCAQSYSNGRLQARALSSVAPLYQQKAKPINEIHSEMTSRKLPLLYDNLTYGHSFLLDNTLSDFLPPYPEGAEVPQPPSWPEAPSTLLRPSYHLVHFPSGSKLSQLLPDNTEGDQSPGEPFVRRMWAGGKIRFMPKQQKGLRVGSGQVSVCLERISDVKIKGNEGDEKIFVTIERRMSGIQATLGKQQDNASGKSDHDARRVLMNDEECSTIEERNIVFMRERSPEQAKKAASAPSKVVKPPHEAEFSYALTPTASLLFRFSALTWNAHSIHLDKHFSREVEGHRNLLFHGPLSLVMIVELLQRHLASKGTVEGPGGQKRPSRTISEIEYRNMAPLYCEEELRLCGREKEDGVFDLWVENKDGGLSVKATATTQVLS